MKEKYNTIQP